VPCIYVDVAITTGQMGEGGAGGAGGAYSSGGLS